MFKLKPALRLRDWRSYYVAKRVSQLNIFRHFCFQFLFLPVTWPKKNILYHLNTSGMKPFPWNRRCGQASLLQNDTGSNSGIKGHQTWNFFEILPEQDFSFQGFTQKFINYAGLRIYVKVYSIYIDLMLVNFNWETSPKCFKACHNS